MRMHGSLFAVACVILLFIGHSPDSDVEAKQQTILGMLMPGHARRNGDSM